MGRNGYAWIGAAALAGGIAFTGCAMQNAGGGEPQSENTLAAFPYRVGGRAQCTKMSAAGMACTRQWPGSYFETAFVGEGVSFRIGEGDVNLKVSVDGQARNILRRPAPGLVAIDGLKHGRHVVRVDVISESNGKASAFLGFFAPESVTVAAAPLRARQMEFIGDSHTVGYANTSTKRACTDQEVWETTDASQGFGALVAARFDADYQINAISGRGVVRNYNGGPGDTVPVAYDYTLFDRSVRADDTGWTPDVVVVGLGTNDFSTVLGAGEKWAHRDALHADFERTYASFLQALRTKHPAALIIVWTAGWEGAEIEAEVSRSVARAQRGGVERIVYAPVRGLEMSACNWHPGAADHRAIADRIADIISAQSH